MKELLQVRQEHGGVFVTSFQDEDLHIPWKPLPLSDYIKYTADHERGLIPAACMEDEIFKKCVVDDHIIQDMDFLKAGTVTTVVQNIWQYSGPSGMDSFNQDLADARRVVNESTTAVLHEMVGLITLAFPYTPEQVYEMDYPTFLLRIIQAESKLLQAGAIQEPVSLVSKETKDPRAKWRHPHSRVKVDAKKMWDEQQGVEREEITLTSPKATEEDIDRTKWWDRSPVLEAQGRRPVIEDRQYSDQGSDIEDVDLYREMMLQDVELIYPELVEELVEKE